MPDNVPNNVQEAVAMGCRRVSMLARPKRKPVNPPDCSHKKAGDQCAYYDPEGSQRLVVFCDGSGGCDDYWECPVGE